jgi:BLOC-1 related complex subunit 6
LPNLDAEAINEIEKEATMLAKDFCKLNKQLESSLNHISAATVCCMQTYKDSINKYCESIEESAKEERIYLIKAKELSKTMEAVYRLQNKISSIKTVITTLDSQI